MKLIQLNIWQGRLIGNVLRFFEQNGHPDILCLQEACHSADGKSYFFDNIADIQKLCGYPYVFFSPTISWKLNQLKIDFGNAILSRYPLTEQDTVFTYGDYKTDAFISDANIRNFQHAVVSDGKTFAHIINHHGFWFEGVKTGNAETARQMGMIADYIEKLDGGVIFTGDLNLLPESPSLDRLNNSMNNLCITRDVKTTRNFTSFKSIQVCDYIFVNDKIQVEDFKVHDDVVSDHNMLELSFTA